MSTVIEGVVPVEQAGFSKGRDTTEQIVGLNSFIETGFEQMEKVGAVFVDLSSAYPRHSMERGLAAEADKGN